MKTINKKLIIFMPAMEGGGVEKNTIIITNYLSKFINDIEFITFDDKFNKFLNKKIKITNFKKYSKNKTSKYYKYLVCLIILIKRLLTKKKTYLFAFQANVYCIILALIFNKKIITRSNSSPSGWNKSYLKNLIFKILFKYPEKIIVNSEKFKREFIKHFSINPKMIYNPVNKSEILIKSKMKINNNFFSKKKCLKIINVARFTDQKDHITLLKAFNIINKIIPSKLLLIGYGSNKFKILDYIKKNKINENVKLIDYTFNPYKYIAKSNLFVLTSLYEGLPNVLLESMVLKKYVISSNCPTGPSEILDNGRYGGLFPVKNYKNLSEKILDFANNKKKYNKKVLDAYKSLKRFDEEKNCQLYLIEVKKMMGIN
jgi:glycosyltransferase involved in cell wall biosynthesis